MSLIKHMGQIYIELRIGIISYIHSNCAFTWFLIKSVVFVNHRRLDHKWRTKNFSDDIGFLNYSLTQFQDWICRWYCPFIIKQQRTRMIMRRCYFSKIDLVVPVLDVRICLVRPIPGLQTLLCRNSSEALTNFSDVFGVIFTEFRSVFVLCCFEYKVDDFGRRFTVFESLYERPNSLS